MPPSDLLMTTNPGVVPEIGARVGGFPEPPTDLLEDDGVPLETNWHVHQIAFLIEIIKWHRRDRHDFFAGGNMFVYYSREQSKSRDFRGPDFFLVNNVPEKPSRPYWAIWDEEGRYPDLIIELMSESTRDQDLTTKFHIYEETFSTSEYVAYDPDSREILAWRKVDGHFQRIEPNERGLVSLMSAGLSLGTWFGKRYEYEATWLRFFDASGTPVLVAGEAESLRADAEKQRADMERQRADAERQRADAADARADALSAELARLKAQMPPK